MHVCLHSGLVLLAPLAERQCASHMLDSVLFVKVGSYWLGG